MPLVSDQPSPWNGRVLHFIKHVTWRKVLLFALFSETIFIPYFFLMWLFRKIYALSLLEGSYPRILFWGSLVLLNAMVWSYMAYEDYSHIWMILWILIWGWIYIQFWSRWYQAIGNKWHNALQMSIFIAYLIKTILSVGGAFYLLYVWTFNIWSWLISDILNSIFILPETYTWLFSALIGEILWIESLLGYTNFSEELYTLYLTVTHGLTMSILTLLLGLFIYPIIRFISQKKEASSL